MKERIFLDSTSTTKPSPTTIRSMIPFVEEFYGNPLSPHLMGQELIFEVEKSIREILSTFSAGQANFVLTSSGAEAISQVIHSVYRDVVRSTGKNQCVTTVTGQASFVLGVSQLEDEGVSLHFAKVNTSMHTTDELVAEAISPRTALLSLPIACPLTGVLQPIASIQKLCALRNILLHVDVTHAIGKIPIDVQEMRIDYMTFNGEQFHAPKGIGGLIVKQGVPICPLIRGEGEDLYFRGGPLNVPMLVACKQALLEAEDQRTWYGTEVARLRSMLEQGVQQGYPEAAILFQEEERLPHVSCMAFPGIYNEFFLYNLHKKGVFASIGGGSVQSIERVLVAGGVSSDLAKTAISFSLSKDTTEKEVERAIQIIVEHAKRLRKLSQKIV